MKLSKMGRPIAVTVVVNFKNDDRSQVFTRYYSSLDELQGDLPGLDGESWDVQFQPKNDVAILGSTE